MSKLLFSLLAGAGLVALGYGLASSVLRQPSASPAPARAAAVEPRRVAAEAPAPGGAADAAAIQSVWRAYRASLMARNGARALTLVTPGSVADYERQRALAVSLSRAQLQQADTLDRYMVLMLRARLSGAELRRMSGSDLLRIAIERGWIGANLPDEIEIERIAGDRAYVVFRRSGAKLPGELPALNRIGSTWLVDLVAMMRSFRPQLLAMLTAIAQAQKTDINGAMVLAVGTLTGSTPPESIWDRPL